MRKIRTSVRGKVNIASVAAQKIKKIDATLMYIAFATIFTALLIVLLQINSWFATGAVLCLAIAYKFRINHLDQWKTRLSETSNFKSK
jgi:hypothetical protein